MVDFLSIYLVRPYYTTWVGLIVHLYELRYHWTILFVVELLTQAVLYFVDYFPGMKTNNKSIHPTQVYKYMKDHIILSDLYTVFI